MSEIPKVQLDMSDFPGLELQSDAHDLDPGKTQDQVNIRADLTGQARVRPGMRLVSFDYEG